MITLKKEDPLISLSDLWIIYRQSKCKIFLGTAVIMGAILLYFLTRPLEYQAHASFREKGKSGSPTSIQPATLFALLGAASTSSNSEAISAFKSRLLLTQLIEEEGLQVTIKKKQFSFPLISRIYNNMALEYYTWKRKVGLLFPDIIPDITAKNVYYSGERPTSLLLHFSSKDDFEIYDPAAKQTNNGKIGETLVLDQARLTLFRNEDKDLTGMNYSLELVPLSLSITQLSDKLSIDLDNEDKSLLRLKLKHENRHVAAALLNKHMQLYQDYLKKEQQQIMNTQVAYLSSRHEEATNFLLNMMTKHADVLSKDVVTTGFADSNSAMSFFASSQQHYAKELLSIELELRLLGQMSPMAMFERLGLVHDPAISQTLNEYHNLKRQADSIEIALKEFIAEGHAIPSELHDPIDLQTAKTMYLKYNEDLSKLQAQMRQMEFVIKRVEEPTFEISSLSNVLHDPISVEMIQAARELVLASRDQNNRGNKELERVQQELALQRGFLKVHLEQTLQLDQLKETLLKEKIISLQRATLLLLKQEIVVLDQQLHRFIATRIHRLTQEKEVLEKHQKQLHLAMGQLPNKWVAEKMIDQQMEINKKIVEEIAKLVESKNIARNLELIQSFPLDLARPPDQPLTRKLVFVSFIGALIGMISMSTIILTRKISFGIPVTSKNLRLAGYEVAGYLSKQYRSKEGKPLLDQDLSTLRSVATSRAFSDLPQATLLLTSRRRDYSFDLAQLMAKQGLRVLILPLSFDQPDDIGKKGLLQYLQGDDLAIQTFAMDGFDRISSGGVTRFGHELIQSSRFKSLLQSLLKQYDRILAISHAKPNMPEAKALLQLFPSVVVTITDENWNDLAEYLPKPHLAFLFLSDKAK